MSRKNKLHRYEIGEMVTIINRSHTGQVIIEGNAKIKSIVHGVEEYYNVQFGDDGTYERAVVSDAQSDPQQYIDELNIEISKLEGNQPDVALH